MLGDAISMGMEPLNELLDAVSNAGLDVATVQPSLVISVADKFCFLNIWRQTYKECAKCIGYPHVED